MVCLVILDAIFVLVELLIDLTIIDLEHGHIAPVVSLECSFPKSVLGTTLHSPKKSVTPNFLQQLFCPFPLHQVFHYLSLALLTFFMVELAGKLFAYQLEFFHHKFEVFDGLVVIVSFILDIVYITSKDAFDGMGLLILLRLWRVARIVNGEKCVTLLMFIRHQREENGLKQKQILKLYPMHALMNTTFMSHS